MKTLAFAVISLLSATSLAVISAPNNIVAFKADSVCRILIFDQGTSSICTGSLIKEDIVLTAGHCAVSASAKVEVGCGYQGYDPQNIVTIKTGKGNTVIQNVIFSEKALGHFVSVDSENDQALVKLNRKITTLPKMKIGNGTADLARPCLLTGYGINKTGTAGILLSAWAPGVTSAESAFSFMNTFASTLPVKNASSRIDDLARSAVESTMQGTSLLAGDSGGPFLCYDEQGELTQVAVSNSIIRNDFVVSGQVYFTIKSFAMKISSEFHRLLQDE